MPIEAEFRKDESREELVVLLVALANATGLRRPQLTFSETVS